tara:strand:- start:5323 stop:6066 length:744 start_codon:yes stop_codon:yes gene_type:complete
MPITYEVENEIGFFTIDNGKVNAITQEMHEQLFKHLKDFLDDNSIKVGILSGSEGKCFSAGDDLNEGDSYQSEAEDISDKIVLLPRNKPIIGAVNSWCIGTGLIYLTLLTDICIAGKSARFGLPEIAYAMAGASGNMRLSRNIPRVMANWLVLTGEKITSEKALEFHLINEITEDDLVMSRAIEVAKMISSHPLIGIQTEMECINECNDLTLKEARAFTRKLYDKQLEIYHQDPEAQSGIEHIKKKT